MKSSKSNDNRVLFAFDGANGEPDQKVSALGPGNAAFSKFVTSLGMNTLRFDAGVGLNPVPAALAAARAIKKANPDPEFYAIGYSSGTRNVAAFITALSGLESESESDFAAKAAVTFDPRRGFRTLSSPAELGINAPDTQVINYYQRLASAKFGLVELRGAEIVGPDKSSIDNVLINSKGTDHSNVVQRAIDKDCKRIRKLFGG